MIYGFTGACAGSGRILLLHQNANWNGQIFIYSICLRLVTLIALMLFSCNHKSVPSPAEHLNYLQCDHKLTESIASEMLAWAEDKLTFSGLRKSITCGPLSFNTLAQINLRSIACLLTVLAESAVKLSEIDIWSMPITFICFLSFFSLFRFASTKEAKLLPLVHCGLKGQWSIDGQFN